MHNTMNHLVIEKKYFTGNKLYDTPPAKARGFFLPSYGVLKELIIRNFAMEGYVMYPLIGGSAIKASQIITPYNIYLRIQYLLILLDSILTLYFSL